MRDLPLAHDGAGGDRPPPRWRWIWVPAKILLTAGVLVWLVGDLDLERLRRVWQGAAPGWLALAFALKAGALWLHEARVWMALPTPRPRLGAVVLLCLGVGLLNLVLPARAGDVAVIAAIHRRWQVPVGTATAVIGVTGFLEAAAFGVILVGVLAMAAAGPVTVVDSQAVARLFPLVAGAALVGSLAIGLVVLVGRRRADKARPDGLLGVAHQTVVDTAALLTSPKVVGSNTAAAALQVGLLVAAFAAGVPAAGIDAADAVVVGSQVLAISSLAGFLLPPSWGVGPAAASKLVLSAYGVGAEEALLYAGVYWLIAHLPYALIGLPALWTLRAQR